jgi:quercetin dioxygenase-like cupin family protein
MKHTRHRAAVATLGVAASAVAATAALASPPLGFHAANLLTQKAELSEPVHVNSDRIKFQTKGPVDVRVQTVTIDPHGYSGWHHHPGMVLVAVNSGTATFVDSACNKTEYGPGSPNGSVFVESGDEPGEVRNTTDQPATVYATLIAPNADPGVFRVEDDARTCP